MHAVSYSDTTTGMDTIHGSTTFTYHGATLTRSTLTSGSDSSGDGLDVSKTWVDANVSLSPASATNDVTASHTVTCTIQLDKGDGQSFGNAPDGTVCTVKVTAGPNAVR